MKELKVLDVTLRDGGCVNNFAFGSSNIEKILAAQEAAGVDIIELGYIDAKNGSECERTQFKNDTAIVTSVLKHKKEGTRYVAMVDYGKYLLEELKPRSENTIDGIRLAFHKKDRDKIVEEGRKIIEKGYDFFIQPMITLRYTDIELLELINTVNRELPDASGFYIVDTFGEMRPNDMNRLLNLVDNNLISTMALGFHSHNNLQMSYSNAISMINFPTTRTLMIDSSIMGMGKGAGNLNTELLLEHLNIFYGKKYNIAPLLDVMDKVINQLHSEFYWGYAPEYYLSSANHCTPSYASHFYNKHMMPIDQVGELLGMIEEQKKISFYVKYAEEIYRTYNESKNIDESHTLEELKAILSGKTVMLVGPGKSIVDAKARIEITATREDVITIGLNTDILCNDYILTTRKDVYEKALNGGQNIIVCSNISKGGRGNVKVLNYSNWIDIDDRTHDSSAVIALNLLVYCGVKSIILAGLDGFSTNITENYFDSTLRYPVNVEQANRRNEYYRRFIRKIKQKGVKVEFITRSLYE